MGGKKERISIRITPNQELVLKEMSEALNTSISMMIRTILGDWITKNEDYIYRIIDRHKNEGDGEKEEGI
jgi:predicted DNA-binding protein